MRIGIAEKVSGLAVAVLLVLGLSLGYFFSDRQVKALDEELNERASVLLDNLAINLEYAVLVNDCESIARLVEGVLAQPDMVYCRVLDDEGNPLIVQGGDAPGRARDFSAAIKTNPVQHSTGEEMILGVAEQAPAEQEIGTVLLRVSLARLSAKTHRARMAMLGVVCAAVVLLGSASYMLLRRVLGRPISVLARATERIAAGNLSYRVPHGNQDEIGALGSAFNKMTADLQRSMVSRDYLDRVIDSMADVLITLNPAGIVSRVNVAAIRQLQCAAGGLIGQPIAKRLDRQLLDAVDSSLRKGESVTLLDVALTRNDGTPLPGDFSSTPIREGDAITGAVITFRDITARKLAEEEQSRLEMELFHARKLEAVGQMAAGVAHEINTPTQYVGDNTRFTLDSFAEIEKVVGVYRALLEACREGAPSPELISQVERTEEESDIVYLCEEIPQAARQSLDGLRRVSEIVSAMREFSHVGAAAKEPIDINRAIRNGAIVSRGEWKYVAEMELDLDPSLPQVTCLAGAFNQVVLNLIVNAAHAIADVVGDAAAQKGTIKISTGLEGQMVIIRFTDTGTGIPEEVRSRIFDHFFTTKEVGKGTGQGLGIVHIVVVEKHGGTITFETEMGSGTTFIVRLPINGDADQAS